MTDPLTAATDQLADILTQENALLRVLAIPAAVALVPAKRLAIDDLARALGNATGSLPVPVLARLRGVRDLGMENQTLLERALAVQRQIIEIIRAAIPKAAAAPRYGSSGKLAVSRSATAYAVSSRA